MKKGLPEIFLGLLILILCSGGGNKRMAEISQKVNDQMYYVYECTADFMHDTYESWKICMNKSLDISVDMIIQKLSYRKEEIQNRIISYMIKQLEENKKRGGIDRG